MKHCCLTLILSLIHVIVYSASGPEIMGQKLTPFWGQEYIGIDLVREEVSQLGLAKVDVAVFDIGFEPNYINVDNEIDVPLQMNGNRKMTAHHGTSVMNLINGDVPYGATDLAHVIKLGAGQTYGYQFYHFDKNNHYPKVISNSSGWRSENVKELSEIAYEKNVLWFLAAGNKFPEAVVEHEISSKALLVGSFAPSGLQSFNTQVHQDIIILAPGNNELATINGKGEHALFGETSGATPLVSGTMINIAALLPEITREQTIKLLRNSAFKSVENLLGMIEHPPLLNSYLAFHVAKRIVSLCPNRDKTCINESLGNESHYDFHEELITCGEYQGEENVLNEMRRRALLTRNKQQLKELACAYERKGLLKNSEYYTFLADGVNLNKMEQSAKKALSENIFVISYYKYLSYFSPSIIQHITGSQLSAHRKNELLDILHSKKH